jgi:iron complex transport system substrate-binding protein
MGCTFKCGFGIEDRTEVEAVREEIMNRPELANVNAVKNGKVYITSNDIAFSGLQGFACVVYWAKWLHPDLFEDLDPQAIHQEYLDRFMRIDYDLDEHGPFVYPPLES